jgi:hypothetical protein
MPNGSLYNSDRQHLGESIVDRPRIEVIDRTYAAILAAKTPAERVAMADSAHRAARVMVESSIRHFHPDWTDEERHREYLRRLLGHGADRYFAARD